MSGLLFRLFYASKPPADQAHPHETSISKELLESPQAEGKAVLQRLHTEPNGLTMVPADVRLLSAKDLHINQATLTGETLPVEKSAEELSDPTQDPLEMSNICFLGSNLVKKDGQA